jgi:multiple sugar transport system substrate-binding protein
MSGKMPARPALYEDKTLIEKVPGMADLLEYAKSCKNRPGSAYYEEVSASMQKAVPDVLLGTKNIDDALSALQTAEEEIYSR